MLIINCGIVRVVCQRRYHDGEDSESMFRAANIQLEYIYDEVQQYANQ
jgi:dCMP deaminase